MLRNQVEDPSPTQHRSHIPTTAGPPVRSHPPSPPPPTRPETDSSLVPKVWQEDQLLPRRPDARGHARDRMAPGGWVARFQPDGKNWQLFSVGFRNQYGLAFNSQGDLFTYDADMEWEARPSGKRGRQQAYSDAAIQA